MRIPGDIPDVMKLPAKRSGGVWFCGDCDGLCTVSEDPFDREKVTLFDCQSCGRTDVKSAAPVGP